MLRYVEAFFMIAALTAIGAAPGGAESAVSECVTVQTTGPRGGEAGSRFLNVEGNNNGKYAAFGLLVFPSPSVTPQAVGKATLTLHQSIARFSKDGRVKLYLLKSAPKDLRFEVSVAEGLGGQLPDRAPAGTADFAKGDTGKIDRLTLALDAAGLELLKAQIAGGEKMVRILITPADDDVAATYFGAGADKAELRPTLKIEPPSR